MNSNNNQELYGDPYREATPVPSKHNDELGIRKITAIASLIYLISPLDIVGDFLPIIGLVDDAGILLIAALVIIALTVLKSAQAQKGGN